jgi:hypothetical protein
MTLRLPKDARKAPDAKPWEELQKHANELYWGDRERSGPPAAAVTPFRGVVLIGCVMAQRNDLAGELVLRTGGVFTFDDKQPEVARALAEQLRETADALDREAGS